MAVLSFQQARDKLIEEVSRSRALPRIESVKLLDALSRVLAEPCVADRDLPPFDRATRDGYAVRASDLSTVPAVLRLVGQVRAGESFAGSVGTGQCVEIMTGAPLPAGADAVVMLEYTATRGGVVEMQRAVEPLENVVPRGSEARSGEVLLAPGRRIGATEIAVLATTGCASVSVFEKPRVAILPTGDEVVEIEMRPGPNQIRNANGYSLRAQVADAGGEPIALGIAPDREEALQALISSGLSADLLLLSGGVSAGKFDLVEAVLARMGAEFFFEGVLIQPGRPLVVGRAGKTLFFGLPGNPVSTMVTFDLFVRPALAIVGGADAPPLLFTRAKLACEIRRKPGLTAFLPAALEGQAFDPRVAPVPWKGSGDMVSLSRANCYLVVPEEVEHMAVGEWVSVLPRRHAGAWS